MERVELGSHGLYVNAITNARKTHKERRQSQQREGAKPAKRGGKAREDIGGSNTHLFIVCFSEMESLVNFTTFHV